MVCTAVREGIRESLQSQSDYVGGRAPSAGVPGSRMRQGRGGGITTAPWPLRSGRANGRCLDHLAGLAGLGQQPGGGHARFGPARSRPVRLADSRARQRPDSDPGNVGRRLDRPDRWRPRPDQYVSRYIHVGFGAGRRSCYPARVPTRRSDLRADGLCPGNPRRDTRLDRTDAFPDSWNNQDRAWTDPGPEVRIEFCEHDRTLGTGPSILRDETLMVHFTCDLCGKDLTTCTDGRFVVKIEAYPGFDPTEIKEDDLEDDPMEAVSQILQRDEALSSDELSTKLHKGFRFDLCPACHRKFVNDPLGKVAIRSFDFSKN